MMNVIFALILEDMEKLYNKGNWIEISVNKTGARLEYGPIHENNFVHERAIETIVYNTDGTRTRFTHA